MKLSPFMKEVIKRMKEEGLHAPLSENELARLIEIMKEVEEQNDEIAKNKGV